MNKAQEKTLEFIEKQVEKQKDKYISGMKNDLDAWEDLRDAFKKFLVQENKRTPLEYDENGELILKNSQKWR